MPDCPVCTTEGANIGAAPDGGWDRRVTCQRCGSFQINRDAMDDAPQVLRNGLQRALVSHSLRKMQVGSRWPTLTNDLIAAYLRSPRLPDVAEMADNLVIALGSAAATPEQRFNLAPLKYAAIVGAESPDTIKYLAVHLSEKNFLRLPQGHGLEGVYLSYEGWERYRELRTIARDSKVAFMAMPFEQPTLDRLFYEHYVPAVAQTGFELRRLDDAAPTGVIDNRMRSEIRRSRFAVVELTNDNRGAYWEGGFCEGLGRPVFYSCQRTFFANPGTHFDTNHCQTVLWEEQEMEAAGVQLKETIRATLPGESKLQDD